MPIDKISTIIALLSGFVSSLWFIKGTIRLNGRTINQLAGTYWDQNPHLLKTFVRQRVEYILGALFLCLSFSVQLIAQVVPSKFLLSCPLSLENSVSVVFDVLFSFLLLSWWGYSRLKIKTEKEIKIAKQKENEKYMELQSLQNQ